MTGSERRSGILSAVILIFVFLLIFITLYERAHVLQDLERTARDFQARIRSPWDSTSVAIVRITDADYYDLFGGESPLAPDRLRELIDAIARGNPAVIGVDLATSDSTYRDFAAGEDWPPIVWARETIACSELPDRPPGCPDDGRSLLDFATSESADGRYGLVAVRRDPDGVIRRYQRWTAVADTLHPAFSTAVRMAAGHMPSDSVRSSQDYFIHYRPWPGGAVFDASFVLRAARSPDFEETGVLRDRIVLLGGSYRAARDRYATPLGEMSGVAILAQVTQTELAGRGTEPLRRDVIGVLLFVNGLALLLLFQLVSFPRVFLVSLVSIPVLATGSGLILEGTPFALWPYLIPLLVAVLIQQLYQHAIRYRNRLIRWASEKVRDRTTSRDGEPEP